MTGNKVHGTRVSFAAEAEEAEAVEVDEVGEVAEAAVEVMGQPESEVVVQTRDTTRLPSGTNCHLRIATKCARNATRRENKAAPSAQSVTFQSPNCQQ